MSAVPWSGEEKYRLLLGVAEAANVHLDLSGVLEAVASSLRSLAPIDGIAVVTVEGDRLRRHALHVVGVPRVEGEPVEATYARVRAAHDLPAGIGPELPLAGSGAEHVGRTGRAYVCQDLEREQRFPEDRILLDYGVKCYVRAPLLRGEGMIGAIGYGRSTLRPFTPEEVTVLEDVSRVIATAVANSRAYEQIRALKNRLEEENLVLKEDFDAQAMYEEIVGASPALRRVLAQIEKVAPTDSTVLLLGETGTGKELLARAIHKRSARASRAMINVNCAALPETLIASELFGHEKGAFTGALSRRKGRFELADGGTLFLDEIGDLPADVQVALLRVLQEGEFERVGGSETLRVDVRLVAATNRDLEEAIRDGRFRSDLYFRLNIFPIHVPPLRDRREDVPILVEYFAARHGARLGKRFRHVDRRGMDMLRGYTWPGNVRELENVVERAVILSDGDVLRIEALDGRRSGVASPARPLKESLAGSERQQIEEALKETRGRVSGRSGAAARLKLPASTLESKIRRLRIDKYRFRSRPGDTAR